MIEKEVAINILEDIQQCLNQENWQARTLSTVTQYKKGLLVAIDEELKGLIAERKKYDEDSPEAIKLSQKIDERLRKIYNSYKVAIKMEEQTMLRILDKFIWYSNRNRLFEVKRYVQQELDNIKGITEVKCKRSKINKNYCKICKNRNCNLNSNPEYKENKMDKSQIIDILQEVKETIFKNDIGKCLEKINEYLKFIEDKTLLEILNRIKLFLDREGLYEAKLYIMLELGNFKDTTPYTCKNVIYDNYDYYCKICTNFNCSSNKNKRNENS